MNTTRFIRLSTAARQAGISTKTLYRAINAGWLPGSQRKARGWWFVSVPDMAATPLLTVGRAAQRIGICYDTARIWIARRKMIVSSVLPRPPYATALRRVSLAEVKRLKREREGKHR